MTQEEGYWEKLNTKTENVDQEKQEVENMIMSNNNKKDSTKMNDDQQKSPNRQDEQKPP